MASGKIIAANSATHGKPINNRRQLRAVDSGRYALD